MQNTTLSSKALKIELWIAAFGFVIMGVGLAAVAVGPVNKSDVIWYMQMGLNNVKDVIWMNRYFHVYLQKIFLTFAPTPLEGVRIYWAFLVAFTGFLVYYMARTFHSKSNSLHALLAVAIYLALPIWKDYSGVALNDITRMMIVTVFVALFFYSSRVGHSKRWLIVLLGVIIYFAFRTKETAVFSGILILGFGIQEQTFDYRIFFRHLKDFLLGVLLGLLLFFLLDGLMLKDPWFSIRLSNWETSLGFFVFDTSADLGFINWFAEGFFGLLAVPFILYLISGVKAKLPLGHKLLWLIPLILIGFLIQGSIKIRFDNHMRFLFPIVPMMSVMAVQFLDFDMPTARKGLFKLGLSLLISGMVWWVVRSYSLGYTDSIGINNKDFVESIIHPFFLALLIATAILVDRYSLSTLIFPLACIFVLIGSPLFANIHSVVRTRPWQPVQDQRYYPFTAYADQIPYDEDMRMCVSVQLVTEEAMLTEKHDELYSLYNILLIENAQRENFTYFETLSDYTEEIVDGTCTYVFAHLPGWEAPDLPMDSKAGIQARCSVEVNQEKSLVFMRCD